VTLISNFLRNSALEREFGSIWAGVTKEILGQSGGLHRRPQMDAHPPLAGTFQYVNTHEWFAQRQERRRGWKVGAVRTERRAREC
jgi:hypothetical protein